MNCLYILSNYRSHLRAPELSYAGPVTCVRALGLSNEKPRADLNIV